jgi:hypothetical protein
VPSGLRNSSSGSCINIQNAGAVTVNAGQRLTGGAGVSIGGNTSSVTFAGGTHNFVGGPGIAVSGNTNRVELQSGSYSFTSGAHINISGNAPNNILNGGTFYFSGTGSGITSAGNNNVTIGPGTYIFDGGTGIDLSGNVTLHFNSGNYIMWFGSGADLSFTGNARITFSAGVHVTMYFYGGSSWSDLATTGNTAFSVPSGEYYFDHGRFLNTGNQLIRGNSVLFYFKRDGYMEVTGNSSFSFSAPTTSVYSGYYPGVFLYSDRANTATFTWTGNSSAVSQGAIYLPSSPLQMTGNSGGRVLAGQVIADRFTFTGNTNITVEFTEVVETGAPAVYLVE